MFWYDDYSFSATICLEDFVCVIVFVMISWLKVSKKCKIFLFNKMLERYGAFGYAISAKSMKLSMHNLYGPHPWNEPG